MCCRWIRSSGTAGPWFYLYSKRAAFWITHAVFDRDVGQTCLIHGEVLCAESVFTDWTWLRCFSQETSSLLLLRMKWTRSSNVIWEEFSLCDTEKHNKWTLRVCIHCLSLQGNFLLSRFCRSLWCFRGSTMLPNATKRMCVFWITVCMSVVCITEPDGCLPERGWSALPCKVGGTLWADCGGNELQSAGVWFLVACCVWTENNTG